MIEPIQTSRRQRVTGTVIPAQTAFLPVSGNVAEKLAEHAAERAVIGAVLQQADLYWTLSEQLQPQDFFSGPLGTIWLAFEDLAKRKEPIDIQTVARQLDQFEKSPLRGDAALDYLADLYAAPANIRHAEVYARHIRDAAMSIRLLKVSDAIRPIAADKSLDAETKKDRVNQLVFEATDQRLGLDDSSARAAVAGYQATMAARMSGKITPGVETGWPRWDDPVAGTGGVYAGDVVVIGGTEGMGKTTWLLSLLRNVLLKGKYAVLYTLEMRKAEIIQILISMETGIPKSTLRDGSLNPMQKQLFVEACARVANWNLHVVDDFRGIDNPLTPLGLRRRQRVLLSRQRVDVCAVDGLWLMEPDNEKERGAKDRPRAVGRIMQDLSDLAKGDEEGTGVCLPIPILITHQYNADVAPSKKVLKPTLFHLAESAGVRRNAQVIIGLWRGKNPAFTEAHLLKDRSGGNQGYTGYFYYDRNRTLYEERH